MYYRHRNTTYTMVLSAMCYTNMHTHLPSMNLQSKQRELIKSRIMQAGEIGCFHPNSSTKIQSFQSVNDSCAQIQKFLPTEPPLRPWIFQNATVKIKKNARLKFWAKLCSNITATLKYPMPNLMGGKRRITILLPKIFQSSTYFWHFMWCVADFPCYSKHSNSRDGFWKKKKKKKDI